MDQAAVWLAGSILFMLGSIVIVAGIIAINNLIHTYWKPITLFKWMDHPPTRFATPEEAEKIAPQFEEFKK